MAFLVLFEEDISMIQLLFHTVAKCAVIRFPKDLLLWPFNIPLHFLVVLGTEIRDYCEGNTSIYPRDSRASQL